MTAHLSVSYEPAHAVFLSKGVFATVDIAYWFGSGSITDILATQRARNRKESMAYVLVCSKLATTFTKSGVLATSDDKKNSEMARLGQVDQTYRRDCGLVIWCFRVRRGICGIGTTTCECGSREQEFMQWGRN